MRIIYNKPSEVRDFDIDKFYKSLNKYGKVDKKDIEDALKDLHYDPMHYSVLVEIGVSLLQDEDSAKAYYDDHMIRNQEGFERLRRITGYLVGSLERWNDGKKAEERERVKHNVSGVYTQEEKAMIEAEKAEMLVDRQDEYQKGI